MSALDRALIRAYRQQRGGAASFQPQPHAPNVEPFAHHAAEAELTGPHYRIDMPGSEVQRPQCANVSAGEWSTFRVDVGVSGVPTAFRSSLVTEPAPAAASAPASPSTGVVPIETLRSEAAPPATTESAPIQPSPGPVRLTISTTPLPVEPAPIVAPGGRPFRPQLVVDRFLWPELCDELDRSLATGKQRLADAMGFSQHRAIAVVGADAGAGASTALLAVARRLIAEGIGVTITDANFRRPALAELLSVKVARGWQEAVEQRVPLEDVLIESTDDRLVLAPLSAPRDPDSIVAGAVAISAAFEAMRTLSEVLLVDAGPIPANANFSTLQLLCEAAKLEGIFLVCDRRNTTPQEVVALVRELKASGIAVLGTIENFSLQKVA